MLSKDDGTLESVHFFSEGFADASTNHVRPTSMTYPNGRVLNDNYSTSNSMPDAMSQIASLIDSDGTTHLADYSYLGLGAIIEVDESQPSLSYTLVGTAGGNDPDTGDIYLGLDRFGRVKDLLWQNTSTNTAALRIQHGYDRASNRLWRADLVAEATSAGFDELYAYDGLYRLKNLQRGTLNTGNTQITSPDFIQCWTLDATGNWKGFREDDTGSGTWDLVQSRTANTVNEITGITNSTGSAWANPAYDANGNMTSLPKPTAPGSGLTGTYDAWNRVVKLVDATSGNTVQTNAYDGLRRRTVKQAYTAGTLSETRHYYYSSSWQVLEERVGSSSNAERQFVWGLRYIDDLILRDRDTNNDGTLDERMYALQDPNWNVVGLTDSSGNVQERYSYDAYGMPTVLTATYGSRSSSSYAWETLYAGYRYDADTGLYLARNRILDPRTGTWGQRDPVGYAAGFSLYEYVASGPVTYVDPMGFRKLSQCEIKILRVFHDEVFKLTQKEMNDIIEKTRVVSDEEKRITDVQPSLLDRLNNLDVSAKGAMKEIAFLDPGTAGITVSPTEIKTRNVNFGCDPKNPCMINPKEISDIVLLSHELVHIIQYGRNPNFQPDYAKDWANNIKNGMKSNRAYECTDAELEAYAFGSTLGSFLRDPAKLALLQNQPCDKPASPSLQNAASDFKKAYDAELKQARAACGK